MNDLLWQLEDVRLTSGDVTRLRVATLTIRVGVTAVLGESGAGKTSLLNLLVGFEKPSFGAAPPLFASRPSLLPLFWVPQDGGLWPHLTAREHLSFVTGVEASERQSVDRILEDFDLADKAAALPHQLSQGERSRLSIARALAARAAVLVMDEPLIHVDSARAPRYWEAIRRHLATTDASLIFSTHAARTVLAHAERVICLRDGAVIYEGSVEELYWRPTSAELAACLGEANWFEPDESKLWLGLNGVSPRCLRPEQIEISPSDNGAFIVESSRFEGALAEVELRSDATGARRRFFHRPAMDRLREGMCVAMKTLLILMLLLIIGCSDSSSDAPTLAVREWKHWSVPPEELKIPAVRSITFAADGREVFTLDTAGRVLVFDFNGKQLRRWSLPEVSVGKPEGICALKDGRVVVCDTHYNRILIFDANGKELARFGTKGTDAGEFIYPVGVAVDAAENLYIAEYGGNDRVQKFSRDGKFLLSFGSFGTNTGQFQRPSGIAWRDGKIYVADAINNRVQVFSDDGKFLRRFDSTAAPLALHFPYGIAVGKDGAFYVVEYGGGRVTKLSADGTVLARYGRTGVGEGEFQTPWGLAVRGDRIWIADTGNRRIVHLKL